MTLTPRYCPSGPPLVIPEPPAGTFDPIFQQFYIDTTKPDGGNGSIGTPLNTWASLVDSFFNQLTTVPTVFYCAQSLDASGTPIPNLTPGSHDIPTLKLQGPIQESIWLLGPPGVSGLVVEHQDGDDFRLDIVDYALLNATFAASTNLSLSGQNASIVTLAPTSGNVFGSSNLINCTLFDIALPAWNLRMTGGTVDGPMSVDNGFLEGVEFLSSSQFRMATSLNLTNCRFQAGAQILCSANQQLNLDLVSWGAMVAAGVTFPDTFPTMTIVPWVTVIGQIAVIGTTAIASGGVTTIDLGVMAPQEAEKNTACIASFAVAVNSKLTVVGAFVDASRHINVLISNNDIGSVDLINPTYTVVYLPRISP